MRTFLVAVVFLAIGYSVYVYSKDPAGFEKSVKSFLSQVADKTSAKTDSDAPTATWTPPTVIPAQPHWTWTTSDGKVYHDVKILKIDASSVTILDSEGGGRVAISTLPPDMQKYFNYDAAAAADAEAKFQAGTATGQGTEPEGAATLSPGNNYFATSDYDEALAEAKTTKKLLLLNFIGSDWNADCKTLEDQVLSKAPFQSFAGGHFIVVTVDFPKNSALPPDLLRQNNRLQGIYNVSSYPTLLVTDSEGQEVGRIVGMPAPADAVLSQLQDFARKGESVSK